jgi:hypothetical protein
MAFSSGCALPSEFADPLGSIDISGAGEGEVEETPSPELAALTSSAEGYLEIVILNLDGETTRSIETSYILSPSGEPGSQQTLMHHSEDFFLVTTKTEDRRNLILRIEWDGTVSEFARPEVGTMYRVDEALDGDIVVAAEFDLIKLDLAGVEVARDHDDLACWTDVVASPNAFDGPVATDVMGATPAGPILGEWTIDESMPVTDSSTGGATEAVGENRLRNEVLGQDDLGGLWMAGRSGMLQRSVAGVSEEIGSIDELLGAFMARAVEPAGDESVMVLVDGGPASQVGKVGADGESEVLFDYSESLLLDMLVLPVPIGF